MTKESKRTFIHYAREGAGMARLSYEFKRIGLERWMDDKDLSAGVWCGVQRHPRLFPRRKDRKARLRPPGFDPQCLRRERHRPERAPAQTRDSASANRRTRGLCSRPGHRCARPTDLGLYYQHEMTARYCRHTRSRPYAKGRRNVIQRLTNHVRERLREVDSHSMRRPFTSWPQNWAGRKENLPLVRSWRWAVGGD